MQIQIQIASEKMAHAKPSQFGAIVAHVMKSKHFQRVIVHKTFIEVMFNFGDLGALAEVVTGVGPQLEKDVIALLDLEPYPCPCGCGQFLAIGPCFEQAGELRPQSELNSSEKALIRGGNMISAIKMFRERTTYVDASGVKHWIALREAKDMCDRYKESIKEF